MHKNCRLCSIEVPELRSSHLIPAGVYKRLRGGSEENGNPNPVRLSIDGAVQTSAQIQDKLLCAECEQLFSRKGESWVLRNTLQDSGRFPLLDRLKKSPQYQGDANLKIVATRGLGIDADALGYFAASIFWRAAVHAWDGNFMPYIQLGPYEEPLRKYLLGHSVAFPENMLLLAVVREQSDISHVAHTPVQSKEAGLRHAMFCMPGLAFQLLVGRSVPQGFYRYCLFNGEGNPVLLAPDYESSIKKLLLRMKP